MEYTQIDLKIVCRTCKCEAWEMKPLYYRDPESGKEDPRLDEMLMTCTSVQVNSEDGLPKLICRSCYLQLKNAFFFKKQCEKTDLFLRGYLKWLKDQESSGRDVEFTANLPGDNNRSGNSLGKSGDKHIDYIEKQCEKTDLFFGDYLKWLKEQESSTGEVELTPNLTGDESVSGSSPGKSDDKNMDYIKVVDNNLTIYECKTCSKAFYTLEGLNCHKKMHTSKAFKCKQCDRSFTKLNQLQKHELLHTRRKKHVCKICNKTLPTQMHLKRHSAIHSKETPYSCPNCNCIFKLPEHLHTHAKSCKSEKVYVCDICKKEFADENSMEIHKREHGNREHALATVDNLNNIKEHCIKIEFDDTASVISELSDGVCIIAGHVTMGPEVKVSENSDVQTINEMAEITKEVCKETNASELLIEKVKIEKEMISDDAIGTAREDELLDAVNRDDYGCDNNAYTHIKQLEGAAIKRGRKLSKKKSGSTRRLPVVKRKTTTEADPESTTYECPQCKLIFNELNIFESHAEQHGLKMYECEICHKKFSRSKNLKTHKVSHSKTKPFACTICNKCFSKRDLLKKHTKLHTSNDVFNCEICRVVFTNQKSLQKHKSIKHNVNDKVKPFATEQDLTDMKVHCKDEEFQCKTCEKTFSSKSHLVKHMRSHNNGLKKVLCTECGQRCGKHDIVTHMRRHRGEKPFKCNFCDKGFPCKSDLLAHERYHTGEKTHLCVICGKGFGRAYNLTVHMRSHTGEKPYRCTYCDTAFAQSCDLKKHVRRHTGERFKCKLCPETFLLGYHLKQHKRVVHGLQESTNSNEST